MAINDLFLCPQEWVDDGAKDFVLLVRKWADREIISKRHEYRLNYEELFIEKRLKLIGDMGLERLVLTENYGGYGWNELTGAPGIMAVLSEVGRADAAIGFAVALKFTLFSVITMKPSINDLLCDALVPLSFTDGINDVALILPGGGVTDSETPLYFGRSVTSRIEKTDGGYSIIGEKLRPVGCGRNAGLYCVVSSTEEGKTVLAFVPSETEGVVKGDAIKDTGLDACKNADISFENVTIPAENVIGRDGSVLELYTWLNLFLSGVSLGAAFNFFEIVREWAETRVIKGGGLLKENPLCAYVLADVAGEIATAKLLCFSLAQIIAGSEQYGGIGGQAIYAYAEMTGERVHRGIMKAINRGMELMGSAGYSKEWHVEKHWRDIKTIQSHLCGIGADVPVKMDIARYFYDCKDL
ncbi:MAG: acyl-CoA/acyl-ACP dehydrogenase [Deltaproteobacteria bacterium]|nr:acyl-CoA/acyl-ACP dehydrogenase [Deltaproteobacteria bacterium]MBN2845566.1 acyl-CoA/acyl-ACP dehydrogenase [Deltaproteobacteria bacterium]